MRHCGLTISILKGKPQDRELRDMHFIGIKSLKIRQELLEEPDPDLETTERVIQLVERLAEDVRHYDHNKRNAAAVTKSLIHIFRYTHPHSFIVLFVVLFYIPICI
jgi:hypothetical protein